MYVEMGCDKGCQHHTLKCIKKRKENKLMDGQMAWQSDGRVDSDGKYMYAHCIIFSMSLYM